MCRLECWKADTFVMLLFFRSAVQAWQQVLTVLLSGRDRASLVGSDRSRPLLDGEEKEATTVAV